MVGVTNKRILAVFMMACILIAPALAVGEKDNVGKQESQGNKKAIVLRIFNAKGENAVEFEAMCKAYSQETGVEVEAFSVGSGTSAIELLRAQMTSKTPPAIYSIRGLSELPEWKESGSVLELSSVAHSGFAKIAKAIPDSMRLSSDGKENLGIPFNIEGYGYMVDTQMLADLFGASNGPKVYGDLRSCSYDEFASFAAIVDAYIQKSTPGNVSLNGNTYALQPVKTGRALKLTGVFGFAGSEKWTYGDHSVNVMLNTVFGSAVAASLIKDPQFEQLREPLFAYMKNLEMVTRYVGGLKNHAERGPELINKAVYGYDQSVQAYADGNVLFLQQGNWISINIEKIDPAVAARSTFIPVKMPLTNEMIKTGKNVKEFNSSIPIYVPNYYAINAKVSKEEQEAAFDFFVWLAKPANTQKYIIDSFKAIPYNADSSFTITDSLSRSIISYNESGKFISNPYMGMPKPWYRDVVAGKVMEEFLNKKNWADKDVSAFVENAIIGLKKAKAQ
ncbi:hypothetical protein MASR2M29_16910 [Spirochaetota bacterium]